MLLRILRFSTEELSFFFLSNNLLTDKFWPKRSPGSGGEVLVLIFCHSSFVERDQLADFYGFFLNEYFAEN